MPVPPSPSADRYLDVSEADALAAALPGLAAYLAADSAAKAAAIVQATTDVDAAMPYQGRRIDPSQPLAFPRTDESSSGDVVVPADVKQATLHQANSILEGTREPRIAAQHDGVVYELTGGMAESYKATPGPGVPSGLCRRAWMIMRRYRLASGRLV